MTSFIRPENTWALWSVLAIASVAAKYWGGKESSLLDIAVNIALAFMIVTISTGLANLFSSWIGNETKIREAMSLFFGNKYLIITTLTMIIATIFSKKLDKLRDSQKIGTFLIYLFFEVIGAPASLMLIIKQSPLLLLFAFLIVFVNRIISLIFGKIFKFSLEEIIIVSNANVGRPTTAAAMAVSKGWTALIVPALLVGILGYVTGNYYGLLVGAVLK